MNSHEIMTQYAMVLLRTAPAREQAVRDHRIRQSIRALHEHWPELLRDDGAVTKGDTTL